MHHSDVFPAGTSRAQAQEESSKRPKNRIELELELGVGVGLSLSTGGEGFFVQLSCQISHISTLIDSERSSGLL